MAVPVTKAGQGYALRSELPAAGFWRQQNSVEQVHLQLHRYPRREDTGWLQGDCGQKWGLDRGEGLKSLLCFPFAHAISSGRADASCLPCADSLCTAPGKQLEPEHRLQVMVDQI